ncbi:MAG: hypothetical protein JWM18_3091, partial [Chloroflexi bacterium]|nr:hypothetical protein [Chloroflexota bacterium]
MAVQMTPFAAEAALGAEPVEYAVDLTVVVPLYKEEENVDYAVEELLAVLDGMPETAEVILVDD